MAIVCGSGHQIVIEVTADPGSITNATVGTVSLTVPGALPGMLFAVQAASLADGLVIANSYCTTAGTVVVRIANVTAAPIDDASQTFRVIAL